MQPTIGRIVYYKSRGSKDGVFPSTDRAAIVTDVSNAKVGPNVWQVRLCVMNPEGLFFTDWLDQGQEGGQWDWPQVVMPAPYIPANPITPTTSDPVTTPKPKK